MDHRPYSYDHSVKSNVSDELINIYVLRPLAGIVVRVLYHTSITPNQVTVAATCAGILAAALYFADTGATTLLAGLCITLKDLLDSADGQLARAKQIFSRAGRFLDSIGDFIVNFLVFGALGYVLSTSSGNIGYGLLAFFGFLGMTLRVSYHVYYQTSYLHLRQRYLTNRVTEDIRDEDLQNDRTTFLLQRVFLTIYGWQDRIMATLDQWCRRKSGMQIDDHDWFADRVGLRLSGFLGLGTELLLLTLCSVFNQRTTYLYCNLIFMNGILLGSIWYRRRVLPGRLVRRT